MDLIATIDRQLDTLAACSLTRRRRITDGACAPRQLVDGRDLLAFCSNDYLGLAAHPQVIEALREGAQLYGAGSGASHLVSGHSRAHHLLEERLAEWMAPHLEQARALTLCTGYMANLAILSALGLDADAMIFSEALTQLLTASSASTKIVVTDSVFSMDGDLAPLPALLAACERHGAWLVVDDAHGFGVLGQNGRGALEHFGLRSSNLIYMGTLGKAAGVGGAFVAAHASVIELLIQRARPYIYTTACPPALAHALLASLAIMGGDEGAERRAHLARLVEQLRGSLRLERWQLAASTTPIQPVIIGSNDAALHAASRLHEQGLWVPAIRPPTVAPGTARLRVTLSAAHATDDVARLAQALNELEKAAP